MTPEQIATMSRAIGDVCAKVNRLDDAIDNYQEDQIDEMCDAIIFAANEAKAVFRDLGLPGSCK